VIIAAGLGYVSIAEWNGQAIAAAVFLVFNQTVIYKYGASDPLALELRPNELILDEAIRQGAQEGRRFFDFGVTAKSNQGLRRFKSKWGAVESDAHYVYFAGQPRPRPEDSRLVRLASSVIRRSPPVVCRLLGEALYRFSQ
jgi:CelD/BcsL family acetyltransferase involved in cellulose biosynthesis